MPAFPLQQAMSDGDGGVCGSIRRWMVADLFCTSYFAQRVASEIQDFDAFPYINILDRGEYSSELQSDRTIIDMPKIQVRVICIGYNQARILGGGVSDRLLSLHDVLETDGYKFTLLPRGGSLRRLPERGHMGGDVWVHQIDLTCVVGRRLV